MRSPWTPAESFYKRLPRRSAPRNDGEGWDCRVATLLAMTGVLVGIRRVNIHGPAYLAGQFVLLQLAYQAAEQLLEVAAPV